MLIRLLFILIIYIPISGFKGKNSADDVLQKVLELKEVEAYFSKTPRFNSSANHQVVLIKNESITLTEQHQVNHIPLTITNESNSANLDLTVFLHIREFNQNDKDATIKLDIQNAALLYEENKCIALQAALERKGNEWVVKDYELNKVNISY